MSKLRTAESVSPKHPDKLCDRISDAILDAYLAQDENARVAIETAGGHGTVFLTGEITSSASVDLEEIVHRIASESVTIITSVDSQSHEIANGVNTGGAGDQGIMTGYATSETPEHLPIEVVLSRSLNHYLYELWPYDGKTQVTLGEEGITSIVASFQHAPQSKLQAAVEAWLSERDHPVSENLHLHVNPAGDWQQGGFDADAGLTGRKLIVDNYGPRIPIGGGCFSGKDPSKVDRSAAYAARKIAIDYLKKYNAREVFVRLAYAIGYDQPLEATAVVDGEEIVIEGYDLSPRGIITFLDLKRPIYGQTAEYGHFGHADFPWEH